MITIFKLFHRDAHHIGLRFAYDEKIKRAIKQLEGIKYSRTHGCWYIPYSTASYHAFRQLHIPYTVTTESGTTDVPTKSERTATSAQAEHIAKPIERGTKPVANIHREVEDRQVNVRWNDRVFEIRLPYRLHDVDFVKSLSGSWWQKSHKRWIVRGSMKNLNLLQKRFQCFSEEEYLKLYELIGILEDPRIIELYLTPEHKDKVMVKIRGLRADVSYIKRVPGRRYDRMFKRWEIDHDAAMLSRVLDYYKEQGYRIINRLPENSSQYQRDMGTMNDRVSRMLSRHKKEYHPMLKAASDALIGMKYSWKTVQSYTGKLIRVAVHYEVTDVSELSADQLNAYLALLAKQEMSNSTLNMVYSAIKFYFEKVKFDPNIEIHMLKRPRKGKLLPMILSIQEVDRMLRQSQNLKHTTILYTIYGGGLRRAELLGLRVQDVLWDRNQILIKAGKGKKDRMVMLSRTLKELLKRYFDTYQPQYWLFEGSDRKGQYSSSSVTKVVKQCARKAGITRSVTPHTLRHCFATHLLDKGVDCRYIKELLGHKDIKTTLIYTHVTNHSIAQISSPLDDLTHHSAP